MKYSDKEQMILKTSFNIETYIKKGREKMTKINAKFIVIMGVI